MSDYNDRFEAMKKHLNDTNQDIADITGLKMTSIKNQTLELSTNLKLCTIPRVSYCGVPKAFE